MTSLQNRAKGMALIGAAFGFGFTFGPLLGAAALVFSADVGTSPWPGYAAALLSGIALLLAIFLLPESLRPGSQPPAMRSSTGGRGTTHSRRHPVPALLATAFASVVSFAAFETTLSLLLKRREIAVPIQVPSGAAVLRLHRADAEPRPRLSRAAVGAYRRRSANDAGRRRRHDAGFGLLIVASQAASYGC